MTSKRFHAPDTIARWDEDPEFARIMGIVGGRTVVTIDRCYILFQLARVLRGVPGCLAELGCYRGGTARLMLEATAQEGGAMHVFDTFAGMPETRPDLDVHTAGQFADTSVEDVQEFLGSRAELHAGIFPDSAYGKALPSFKLVHIDADIYESVRAGFIFFSDLMVSGGVIVFDDYGFNSCPGARKAVDELLGDRDLYLPTGQLIVLF